MVLTETIKNCEGSTGIRNRLQGGRGRSFQLIEAPRGCPFGGGAGESPGIGGDGACSPEPPLRFAIVL